jgi:hypothetical protein
MLPRMFCLYFNFADAMCRQNALQRFLVVNADEFPVRMHVCVGGCWNPKLPPVCDKNGKRDKPLREQLISDLITECLHFNKLNRDNKISSTVGDRSLFRDRHRSH